MKKTLVDKPRNSAKWRDDPRTLQYSEQQEKGGIQFVHPMPASQRFALTLVGVSGLVVSLILLMIGLCFGWIVIKIILGLV